MRDLTIESLPADERATADDYVERFTAHLMAGNPRMNELAANDGAKDFVRVVCRDAKPVKSVRYPDRYLALNPY